MGKTTGRIARDDRKSQNGNCAEGSGGRGYRNHALRPLQAVLRVGASKTLRLEVGLGPRRLAQRPKGPATGILWQCCHLVAVEPLAHRQKLSRVGLWVHFSAAFSEHLLRGRAVGDWKWV